MTGKGAFALLCGILLLLIALALGNSAAFLLGISLLSACCLAMLSALCLRLSLRIQQSLSPAEIERGQEILLKVRISAFCPLPCAPLTLALRLPDGKTRAVVLPLRRGGQTQMQNVLSLPHVGRYSFGILRLTASDGFGFFRFALPVALPETVLALPRPVFLSFSLPKGQEEGGSTQRFDPDFGLPEGNRDWHEGDELSRIHWKLSAQRGVLTVRTYEQNASPVLILLVSLCTVRDAGERDAVLESAYAFLRSAVSTGQHCQLLLAGQGDFLSCRTMETLPALRRILACQTAESEEDALQALSSLPSNALSRCSLAFCSAHMTSDLASALLTLTHEGQTVYTLLCCSPDDSEDQEARARLHASGIINLSP